MTAELLARPPPRCWPLKEMMSSGAKGFEPSTSALRTFRRSIENPLIYRLNRTRHRRCPTGCPSAAQNVTNDVTRGQQQNELLQLAAKLPNRLSADDCRRLVALLAD